MKKILALVIILVATCTRVEAQFFNNVNNELCLKMYNRENGQDGYTVYMVMEYLDSTDVSIIQKWGTLTEEQKHQQVVKWSDSGKRVEVENGKIVMNPPVFPKNLKKPVLMRQPPGDTPKVDPWGGKKFGE